MAMNPIYTQLAQRQREQRQAEQTPVAAAGTSVSASSARRGVDARPGTEAGTGLRLFFEREEEVNDLYRVLNHRKGGRAPVVILHGDGSSGKSTLIHRGLLPKFRRNFKGVFLSITLSPKADDDCRSLITSLAATLIDQLPSPLDREPEAEENAHRKRHFEMLAAGDSGEAAEYLAALFREAYSDDGPADTARCLLFIDPLDRFFPNGLIDAADPTWRDTQLLPLIAFLHDMALTNAFPLVMTVRSFNVESLRSALADVSKRISLDWKGIDPLPTGSLTALVDEDASLPNIEPALVARCEELLELHPGALAFLEDTWRAQNSLERPPMTLDFFEDERPLEKIIAGSAEAAIAPICPDDEGSDGARGFHALMDMFFPAPEGSAPLRAVCLPYAELATRPAAAPLIEALTDARVLHSGGNRHETATIEWSVPRFFRHWQRGFDWLQKDRERREAAEQLKTDLAAWKKADQSAVLLMHGTASLELANELLDHHRRRPFLGDDMCDYFEQSIATDLRLRPPEKKRSAAANPSKRDRNALPPTVGGFLKGIRGLFRR
jgi:hypothetical protein